VDPRPSGHAPGVRLSRPASWGGVNDYGGVYDTGRWARRRANREAARRQLTHQRTTATPIAGPSARWRSRFSARHTPLLCSRGTCGHQYPCSTRQGHQLRLDPSPLLLSTRSLLTGIPRMLLLRFQEHNQSHAGN
jgi:hypothetical protein